LEFEQFARTQKTAFRFYADFESFLIPHVEKDPEELKKIMKARAGGQEPASKKILKHQCSGFAWICVDYLDRVRYHHVYRTSDSSENVAVKLVQEISNCRVLLAQEIDYFQAISDKSMVISEREKLEAKQDAACGFCKRPLSEPGLKTRKTDDSDDDDDYFEEMFNNNVRNKEKKVDYPVRHHDHLPPCRFQFYAHNSCNLQARLSKRFPVFFHNGSNYDVHYIIRAIPELKKMKVVESATVIPNSTEKFMTLTVNGDIVFLDSLRFTMASLDKLVKTLSKDTTEKFDIVEQVFGGKGDCTRLLSKGAYPYTYMDSVEKFKEEQLPPIDQFYNDMTEEPLDEETYNNALEVWKSFNIRNMGEWQDLYCLLDVALLATVIEKTRKILYEKYELEMTHYFSLPMVSMDAALKLSGVKLQFIKDPTLHCFLESAIRGGYCAPGALRAAVGNNPYMQDEYKPEEPISYIEYVDATNLYGELSSNLV